VKKEIVKKEGKKGNKKACSLVLNKSSKIN
jgi:hypothetical protein